MLGLDSGQDLLGMVVDALAATTGLLGLLGDGAVGPGKRAAALAIQRTKGMVRMGMGPLGYGLGLATAPMRSIPQRIKRVLVGILPSVNLKVALSAPLWDDPRARSAVVTGGAAFQIRLGHRD